MNFATFFSLPGVHDFVFKTGYYGNTSIFVIPPRLLGQHSEDMGQC